MELSFLRPIYARPGPWASIYLNASRNSQTSRPELDIRWRAMREQLRQQGAEPATVAALDDVVRRHDPRPGEYGLAAFATEGEVVLSEYLSAPPMRDLAAHAPLAHTMPLLAQRGDQIPWVRVLANRSGADLDGVSVSGAVHRAQVKGGNQYPLRRIDPGGWSQSNWQRAGMTSWHRNAGDAAAATEELASAIGAEVIVVAGDTRIREMIAAALPTYWQERVVHTDAGFRAAGADNGALDDVTVQAIAEVATAHAEATLDKFGMQEQIGNGLDAVVDALQRGQVETMLLVDDPSSTEELWIGDQPTEIATSPEQLTAMSVTEPRRVRADAALVRALVGTDAGLTVLGPDEAPDLPDGVGAILRYADASTPGRTND